MAWDEIDEGQVDVQSPLNEELTEKIKDNDDDHETRILALENALFTQSNKTANYPVTALDCDGFKTFTNKGAAGEITFTLPTAIAGLKVPILNTEGQNLIIAANASDKLLNRFGVQVDNISRVTAGWAVTLWCIDATNWVYLENFNGDIDTFTGFLNIIGGQGASGAGARLSDNDQYDDDSNAWSAKTSIPTAIRWGATHATEGKLFHTGGGSDAEPGGTNDTREWEPVGDAWSSLTDMAILSEASAYAVSQGKLYRIGGRDNPDTHTEDLREYDIGGDSWSQGNDYPAPTDRDKFSAGGI